MENLIDKIKKRGHWKIIIRPTEFNEKRIPNKETCIEVINNNKVVLTGWDYPHIDHQKGIVRSGPDSVASFSNWPEAGHIEYWKFYQNGQFAHYLAMKEDYTMDENAMEKARQSFAFTKLDKKTNRFFSVLRTLYLITEIHIFAANLAKAIDFGKETEIIIELGNVQNRVLFFWGDTFRDLFRAYTCEYEPIIESRVMPTKELISDPVNLALDFTIDIFKEFNWNDANKNVFAEDQKKLLGY